MTRRIALIVEYEGTCYAGFQRQANAPSIQEDLESAIESLTKVRSVVRGAGRTDAGVHATAQIAAFDTESLLHVRRFVSGLNHCLAYDLAVRSAYEVHRDFDPRRHAVARVYRYRLLEGGVRSPMRRRFTHRVACTLDVEAMSCAAATLLGEHDFRAFSGTQPEGKSFVRTLKRAEVWRDGDEVLIELEGNAFLRQQVRRTAAALLSVGQGRVTQIEFAKILNGRVQGQAQKVLPALGLTLQQVKYADFPPESHAATTDYKTHQADRP